VSGNRVTFLGVAMAAVVQGIIEVRTLIGRPPVVIGGLAVLSRLSSPYRATVDLDVVDRLLGDVPHLEVLRAADGATPVEPASVLLPTPYGTVKIDVHKVHRSSSTSRATTRAIGSTRPRTPGRTTRHRSDDRGAPLGW
jgi:hypothetical protein